MNASELKDDLHRQLRGARAAVLWKLDGLSEYDVRRPLVPTGTNLLGLVKHLATVEWGHFGAAFGDPLGRAPAVGHRGHRGVRRHVGGADRIPQRDRRALPAGG